MSKINDFLKKCTKFVGIPAIFSFLGAYAGSEHTEKGIRRFGLPGITMLLAIVRWINLFPYNLWFITIFFQSFVLAMGYGFGDDDPKPSKIGGFFYKLFNKNWLWTNIFTRGVIGFFISLSLISIPILIENWINYLISSLIIIIAWATISWRNLGSVKMGKYTLCNSDSICYGLLGFAVYFLLFTKSSIF